MGSVKGHRISSDGIKQGDFPKGVNKTRSECRQRDEEYHMIIGEPIAETDSAHNIDI